MRMYSSSLLPSTSTSTSTKRQSYAQLGLGTASHPTCLVYSFGSLASKGKLRHHAICKDIMILTRSDRITLPRNIIACPATSHHRQEPYHASPYRHRESLGFSFLIGNLPPLRACLLKRRIHRETHSLSFSIFHCHLHRRGFRRPCRPCRAYRPSLPFRQWRT